MTVLASDLTMEDGYQTIIEVDGVTAKFYEREITPGDIDAGGKINTSHMRRTAWRTGALKQLKTLGDTGVKVVYAGAATAQIMGVVGVPKLITITYPAGDTLEFWGGIDKFQPGTFKEGEQPEGTITIIATLTNPATGAEVAPVWTAGPELV